MEEEAEEEEEEEDRTFLDSAIMLEFNMSPPKCPASIAFPPKKCATSTFIGKK